MTGIHKNKLHYSQPAATVASVHKHCKKTLQAINDACRVITIHNNPENIKLPKRFKQLRLQLADVDTQNVSQFFDASYQFIEEGRGAGEGERDAPPGSTNI